MTPITHAYPLCTVTDPGPNQKLTSADRSRSLLRNRPEIAYRRQVTRYSVLHGAVAVRQWQISHDPSPQHQVGHDGIGGISSTYIQSYLRDALSDPHLNPKTPPSH